MLAELVDHVIGIDPDKDWITAAIIEADTARFIWRLLEHQTPSTHLLQT